MRTKDEKLNQEQKKKILESALTLFCENGYGKTSMDSIVKHSGISKGGIYYYFKNKEAIFCELGDNILHNRKELVEKFPPSYTAAEKFRQFILQLLTKYQAKEYQKDIKFGFEFWNDKKNSDEINGISKKEHLDRRIEKASEDFIKIINEGIDSGEFRDDINVEDFLFCLHASIDGTAFFVSLLERELSDNKIFMMADIYCEYLIRKQIKF